MQKFFPPPHFRSLRCTGCGGVRCFQRTLPHSRGTAVGSRRIADSSGPGQLHVSQLQPCADDWLSEAAECIGVECQGRQRDRKSTRLNSSHLVISYAVFCLKKKKKIDSASWCGLVHAVEA